MLFLAGATTVHCERRAEYLRSYREAISIIRPPKLIVLRGHNIWQVTERLFTSEGCHISLCAELTKFKVTEWLLWPGAITVHCGQRTQHLTGHKKPICGHMSLWQWPQQNIKSCHMADFGGLKSKLLGTIFFILRKKLHLKSFWYAYFELSFSKIHP